MKNGVPLSDGGTVSGSGTPSLTLANVSMLDAASYTVTVSGDGSITSEPAVLTVLPNGPYAFLQAGQASLNPYGQFFSFTVTGLAGSTYAIQCSTNMVNWNTVETVSTTNTSVEIILENPIGAAYYYRAVVQP
jgi:hypothetical protein